jgi:hypothetical protein
MISSPYTETFGLIAEHRAQKIRDSSSKVKPFPMVENPSFFS